MKKKKYKIIRRSTSEPIQQKHDKGYKRIFSKKQNFLHFLKKYIQADWVNNIDENDLTLIDKTFIDADFKQKESDVIYKLKFKDREIIFYILLELQSSVDFTMPFRLLRYMTSLLKREFNNTPKNAREAKDYRLPAVVPIVLYNGSDNWTAVKSFKEYLQGYEQFGEYVIDFKYLLFDLNRKTEETILSTEQLLDMVFALDKAKRDDMERILQIAIKKYRRMGDDDREDMLNWLRYIWLNDIQDESEKDKILSNFERGEITNMMSGFGYILQEERQKGKKESKIEMAKKMIAKNAPINEIIEFTGLTEDEIIALKGKQLK